MSYSVKNIQIENGVITADNFGSASSIKAFFESREQPPILVEKVIGWNFPRVYLTHGSMENGAGFAFVK